MTAENASNFVGPTTHVPKLSTNPYFDTETVSASSVLTVIPQLMWLWKSNLKSKPSGSDMFFHSTNPELKPSVGNAGIQFANISKIIVATNFTSNNSVRLNKYLQLNKSNK